MAVTITIHCRQCGPTRRAKKDVLLVYSDDKDAYFSVFVCTECRRTRVNELSEEAVRLLEGPEAQVHRPPKEYLEHACKRRSVPPIIWQELAAFEDVKLDDFNNAAANYSAEEGTQE